MAYTRSFWVRTDWQEGLRVELAGELSLRGFAVQGFQELL